MRKRIALLLAAVLCLSLAACGGTEETSGKETQGQQTSQNTQQTGDESSKTEPKEQVIEITLDNWQEYLEFNQYLGVSYVVNAFDEVTDTCLKIYTLLELKEEYSNYIADVAVEYDMDYCVSDIIYNLDDFSFELIDCVSHPDATVHEDLFVRGEMDTMYDSFAIHREKIVDGKVEQDYIWYNTWNSDRQAISFSFNVPIFGTDITQNEDGTGYIDRCPTNIQITRIEGTLEYNN